MAVVSSWLDDPAEPACADTGAGAGPEPEAGVSGGDGLSARHDDARRPWALSPPHQVAGGGGRGTTLLEVRILHDRFGERLERACRSGTRVRLGAQHLTVAAGPECLEQVSWQALTTWSGQRAWQVRAVAPMTFRRRNRTSPWPDPVTLARGLHRRWQLLHPDTAPDPQAARAESVWVSDLDGHSEVVSLRGRVVSGFVGRLRYVADGSDADAEAFHALMSFAAFAGIGSHTTYGFGTITPEPTWQPPTTRHP
jgi:CRISPR-associated endoribonuclease Cas6